MKYELIDAMEELGDDNNGYIYGIQEISDFPGYIEWFKTEAERDKCLDKIKGDKNGD